EPGQPVDDCGDRFGGRALAVGVLDAQPKDAAIPMLLVMTRIEPVEQRGAGAADMQKPGRGRGETDGDAHRRYVRAAIRLRHPIMEKPSPAGTGEGSRNRNSVSWLAAGRGSRACRP